MTPVFRALALFAAPLLLATAAQAAGTLSPAASVDAAAPYEEGMAAAEQEDWAQAVLLFSEAVKADPDSADAYNMLAYSQRHMGDLETAIRNYGMALDLDPRHEGAREYLGEALLLSGDLEGARAQLQALQEICPQGCEALEELREAIQAREAADS